MKEIGFSHDDIEINMDMMNPRRGTVLMMGKADATLDQFEILKLIGKGTFGKVFLIQNLKTGKLFAMKCIRKDLILEAN